MIDWKIQNWLLCPPKPRPKVYCWFCFLIFVRNLYIMWCHCVISLIIQSFPKYWLVIPICCGAQNFNWRTESHSQFERVTGARKASTLSDKQLKDFSFLFKTESTDALTQPCNGCLRTHQTFIFEPQPTNGRQISLSCQVHTWLFPQETWIIKLLLCGERICRKLSHFRRFEQSRYIMIRESAHNNPVLLSALGRAISVVVRFPNPLPGDLWCQAGNLSTRVVA